MNPRANRPEMGIATQTSAENKELYARFLDSFADDGSVEKIAAAALALFDPNAEINASHPINEARPGTGYVTDVIGPIANAFEGLVRQNYVMIGGEYLGAEWVTSTGYFHGHFTNPLFGIPLSGKLAYLRDCDWWRCQNGKIIENWCMLDIPHLLLQLGYDLFSEISEQAA